MVPFGWGEAADEPTPVQLGPPRLAREDARPTKISNCNPSPTLFADKMERDLARVRGVAMFPQVNALPRAERQASVAQGQAEVHGGERGADVRRHVVRALAGMDEERIAVGHEAVEEAFEIAAYVRVGVFLDEQRGGRVPQVQGDEPMLETTLGNPGRELSGEIVQPATARGHRQFVESLVEHGVSLDPGKAASPALVV